MSVADLSELTGASTITVRRDLAELAELGALARTHGGAGRASARGSRVPYSVRLDADRERKSALARAVGALVRDGESIILDNGTTCLAVAEQLAERPVVVLPLSLIAALTLASGTAEVILPGGPVERDVLAMTSAAAIDAVRAFRADTFVLGTCAASSDQGLTSDNYADAAMKREAMRSSARRILVSTGSKLNSTASFRFASYAELDRVVTTRDAPPAVLHDLRSAGAVVDLVDV